MNPISNGCCNYCPVIILPHYLFIYFKKETGVSFEIVFGVNGLTIGMQAMVGSGL